MWTDYIINGQATGEIGSMLEGCRFDPGLLRPYKDTDSGVACVTMNTGRKTYNKEKNQYVPVFEQVPIRELVANGIESPVFNATTLRKDEWLEMDRKVLMAARQRLSAWSDLEKSNSFGGFNGMGTMILEHETMSDPGEAMVDMEGVTEGRTDTPRFQLEGLPLPITHGNFWVTRRRLEVSRRGGTPFDSSMAEAVTRRVADQIEKTLIGTATGITYGTAADYSNAPTVYGYTNHPDRVVKTNMTAPTGTNGTTVLSDWLALRDDLYDDLHYGPYTVYTSTDWDQYLDNEFKTNSDKSLRQRLLEIDGISAIKRLDFLTNTFTVLFVQMTPDVARAVNGMELTTVQWESMGGMKIHFKVMAIKVPQIRSDFNERSGIGHGTTT
jgi:hypothetical protein